MATCEDVRKIALALPGVREADHWGRPSFRIGDRIFATLWPAEGRAVLKVAPELQELLCAVRPETYSLLHWGKLVRLAVELKHASAEELEPLLREAWESVTKRKKPDAPEQPPRRRSPRKS